ncbi:uncharacterized protein LOC119850538 isoform X10 [Dermochelys coriacea]|uniref:uncharacterized protein LOC119850538 isoform X10 n=1 Tax=Dermochelys coriacea TaxID=27794 RepID=UPI001CA8B469|nr:uncharacterized protein LOC119850538 isoform X10 [Dermochelys coriacea]
MATICQTHGGELNQCHLRSIGRKASVFGVAEVIHFYKAVTLIGRNKDVVDYFISCPVSERRDYISRTHARVIRTNDTYRLVDSSLTGVYVNDVRINGTISLQEGDTVTFGHPAGNGIRSGTQVRQPNSEFYFLFEHCYCRIEQLQSACGEMRNSLPQIQLPLLTSPEVPPVYNAGLVFKNNVGLPVISQLAWTSQVVPNSGALSKSSTHCGDMQPPTVTVTLPLTSAGSVLSSVKSSLCTNSVNVTSNKLEMPATSTSAATADTSLEDYTRPNSQIVRSSSPEYVHQKGSAVTTEPSQQRVFEIAQSSLFRENAARTAELANSDFLCVKPSGAQPCTLGSMSKFYRPFLDERRDSGETETQPPVTCYNLEPSPPFPHSRDAVETHDSDPSGKAIVRASLSDNSLDLSDSFPVESGSNLDSKPLVPVADKSVLGSCANSDDDDVVMEINVINSTEETAKHETSRHSEPCIQMQVTEVINEAMKNVQVPSVSDYKANLMEKERSTEEQNRYSLEQHIVDACVHETPCVAVSVTGDETCESHSKKKGRLHVNSLSESVIVEVENCSENSDCMAISIVPEDITLGKDLDGGSPAKEVVSPKKLMNADGKTCVEELDLPSETAMTIDRIREVNISFVPDLELPHSVWHSEMKNEICKDELTSVIKQNSLMSNEEAIKESSDIVECESCSLADREMETLNTTLHMETQKPETTSDIQEGAEPNTDKIITISNREVREIHRDHVFEDKLQNALDQEYMLSDTGISNLEHQNSSDAHKILTMCAAKEMSGSECNIGSAKSQKNEDDNVIGVALFQSCVTEQVVSRASGTKMVQCLDMLHSEEEESSMDSHVALDGLVTKILQNNPDLTAPENLPLCTQNISDYHVHSPSKHHILSQGKYLEDITYSPCNCVPSSSGSLHSENSPHKPAPKEEELSNSGAVVKPLSRTFCSLQATAIEITSPEYPCTYEDSGALTSVTRSISETMSQGTNIQPLSQNETETSVKQNACNKANISHATVCIESEGFQSDHVCMTTSVSTKGVPQEVSDFGFNKLHLEVSASEADEEQTDMNVNSISLTMDSPVRYGDKDESEIKMDSMDTETRISSVTDCVEISYAEVETQTRQINERAINLLATKPSVNGNKNSVSNTSICEEEVNMSVDTHLSLQQFSEAYERTMLFDNASKNSWREFSKQMEIDSKAKEKLSSETRIETFDGKTIFVASCSPNKVTFLENTEKLVEAINPESPINVGEKFLDRCLLQKSDCTLERKRSPGKEDKSDVSVFSSSSLSTTNTRCIKTVEILVRHTLDSTLTDNNEMHDTDYQELKTACLVVDDTASGEKQFDQSASIENTFYKKTDEDGIESKEIMKIPGERHDSGTAINGSVFEEQKNIENKGIDKEMEIMANVRVRQTNLNHSSVTKVPTNRLEGNTAYYSSELEGGIANDLSPLCLSKQTSLVAERSSDFNDYSCSQTQSPYYVNKRDMGNYPEPVNDYILPQQDTRNEEGMKLNDENTGETVNCKWSVKSVTLEKDNADTHFSELDLGTLNNYQEDNENSSVSAAHLELRQQSSAFHDQQETDSYAVESQHLESNIDLKSKEDPVKQPLYPEDFVIDSDLKKLCEQNMTTEILTPIGLERSNQKSICQEEGGIKLQTTQLCNVDKNDLAVGMQAIAFGKPESAKKNIAENHLREIENDPTDGSELFSAEELNLYISDSEVEKEKEENNSTRMKNTVEMQHDRCKILKEKDTIISDPNSVSGSIILQADLDCKPNEDQLDRVIETADLKSMIDLTPSATMDWNTNSPIQEQITSHVRLGINSHTQLKRELSHEEHSDSGNRNSISPPSKMCPPDVVAISSESAIEEPAPNQKEIGSPDASGSCSTSQTHLTEHLTQTPSKPEAKHSLSLKKLKSSYVSIPPSAVEVSSASQKAVDSNVSRCLQSSYFNSQLELSSSKFPPPEASDSAEVINSHHERTDKEEDFAEDNQHGGQQNQNGQTNLYDYMDGRVTLEPCIAVGSKEPSDLQTTNDFSSTSSMPKLEGLDLSRSTLNSLACEPATFPGFKEENLQCSLHVQMPSDTSDNCRLDFKEYPTTFSPVISTLHKCGASETSVSSLPDHLFQPMSMANLQIQGRVLSACTFSQPASEHVYSSDEEASCHSEDLGEDMKEFPSMSTESSSAIGLLSETKNLGSLSDAENSAHKASSSNTNIMESELQKAWALSEGDIEFQLSQCQTVLDDISQTLCAVEGIDKVHMEEWREQIEKLQKDTKMPKTYIAVVGNTGAGKSSLLNALLDEEAVLPTSAMRACTAVVVEISKTGGKSLYEADVEFLSKEEWDNELKALLEDMKDKSGNLKKRCPDRKTEAGAAYSRVKAVYGTIAELPKLKEMKEVTQHLGTVKHISAEKAADFRTKIEKFIDSRTDNLRDMKGGEFWPIVKCVKIRVPGANVLKTGAVLVDLPGIRDSNAARDNAAKEYLKNCNAVWVVASITRAVDDKTAKEMLSANLRRQLLMDGQYGSLAFVCTKTDSFNVTEIMSDLDLRDEIQPMEKSLEELENQRVQMEMEKDTLYTQLQQEQQRKGPGAENPASFQKENDLRKKILEKEFRISKLQREKDMKLRDISLICVQSRNRFSKQRIWVDFNNGLQEMRRKAAYDEDEEEEETEDEELTTSDTSDPGEVESQHGKLLVFTVSSTEYLKLHGKLLRDGQPQVFHNEEDTEIPALKKFAIHTALQHSMVATEKVIRNVARIISQVVNYLTNQRAEDNSHRAQVQEIVQECLSRLHTHLQEAMEDSLHDIKYYFSVLILASLKKGARRAEELCEDKVRSWGLPVIGYPYATYRAVCARQGVYSSGACGFVDFNEQLTEPISSAISMTWNDVFSCRLGESIKQFSKAILDKLKYFFRDLTNKLQEKGRNTEPVSVIQRHQMEAVQALLCNFLLDQTEYINKRQRGISRVLTPEIQASMKPIYAVCSQLNGPGCFQRMKDLMQRLVHNQKETMFSCVTDKLRHQLDLLQIYIGGSFESLVQELTKSLTLQFEPMLKLIQKNDGIIPDLVNICAKVSKICKISRVDYVLPNLNLTESCSVPSSPGRELPLKRELQEGLDPQNFLGKCNIIHIGTVSLSHINPIQISAQEITITMTDHTTMTLPFSSVYLCECCFHLYYLILHLSPEFAKNIYSRLGAQALNPNLGNQEVLIILDKPQDPSSFHSLVEFISARHGGIPWFRELNLQQGREKLESLGVYYTVKVSHHEFCMLEDLKYDDEEKTLEVSPSSSPSDQPTVFTLAQQPQLPGMKLYPYGRKRGGGEIQSQWEKKHKGKTIEQSPEAEPAAFHLPSQHIPGGLVVSARQSMASHPQNASRECAPAFYEWNTTSFPGTSVSEAPSSSHVTVKVESDLFTIPSAAGNLHVGAKEGVWGKWQNPNAQEDNSSDVDKMETNGNTHTAKDSWSPH